MNSSNKAMYPVFRCEKTGTVPYWIDAPSIGWLLRISRLQNLHKNKWIDTIDCFSVYICCIRHFRSSVIDLQKAFAISVDIRVSQSTQKVATAIPKRKKMRRGSQSVLTSNTAADPLLKWLKSLAANLREWASFATLMLSAAQLGLRTSGWRQRSRIQIKF